jgi:hypothetical protein
MGYRDDDHEDKGGMPRRILVRLVFVLLILPLAAVLLGIDIMPAGIGFCAGAALLAFLERRYRRGSGFPIRSVVLTLLFQALTILIVNGTLVTGTISFLDASGFMGLKGYSLITEYSSEVKTMSVILPCANEMMFAVKTVRSLGERTPKDVLLEVIVVDDGSTPPLEEYFKENGADVLEKYPVKFVRHETFTGLINAKKQGGDRAKGDVLTFLDCHVLPRDYGEGKSWSDGIMSRISGNYRRIVVPSITDLEHTTWTEIGRPPGIAKCYLSFDVDFIWFDSEDDFVPIMSGGLLAMSRRWWTETGGYDASMIGWGGENIDQSLRAWLCGGEIVQATDSHVAHLWRVNHKPETKAKYTVPEGSVNTNRYRAALAWFDDYIEKANTFGAFSKFAPPSSAPLPNIETILEVKQKLQCKPFQWYLDNFSKIYFSAGVLADEVFRIRDVNTNLCIARRNSGRREVHDVVAATCSTDDPHQLFHRGNRDGDKCCSGLRSYDSMYCLSGSPGGKVTATECNTYGKNGQQFVSITSAGEVKFTRSNACVSLAASAADLIVQTPCDQEKFLKEFVKRPIENNDGFGNGLFHIVEPVSGECLTSYSPVGGDEDPGSLELSPCDSRSVTQQFKLEKSFLPGYVKIINWENLCLDSADGKRLLAYSCYEDSVENGKQVFSFDESTRTIRNQHHPTCLAVPDSRIKLTSDTIPVSIAGCVVWNNVLKPEQIFSKVPSYRKKSNAFLIKSDQWCLSSQEGSDAVVLVKCPTNESDETDKMLWSFESLSRVRNWAENKCLDGNDHKTPILYPCYSTDNDNQEWSDPKSQGNIKNTRAQMCLDYKPNRERTVSVSSNCKTGGKWEMHDPQESLEMKIYKRTKARLSEPVHG